ncbi:helix-turn-helix transcriptional regulator [Gordonia sp. SND2]|uniref:helix-turn-helix transcriptional regulator n=1 Tax=Gordonia sp. SND2 TaxID=3388659 RepID=UPI00398B5C5C
MAHKPTLNTPEAAEYVNSTVATLNSWRYLGRGPAYIKLGRRVVYRVADLDAWLDANTITPGVSA